MLIIYSLEVWNWKLCKHIQEYDPFKNSHIVLFVYITQGLIHGQREVEKVGIFNPESMILFTQDWPSINPQFNE